MFKIKITSFLIFFYFFCSISATTNFVHLIGYIILAEPLQTIQGSTEEGCADQCASNENCIGFEFSALASECTLLTSVRNIVTNISECNFYIYDRIADTNFTGSDITEETDKLVYSNAYINGTACPQGATDDVTECSIVITEEKCDEYATFFNASYDGTKCIFATVNRSEWFCAPTSAADNWMYFTEEEGFCYFKTTASAVTDMATFIQNCQAISANSFPVTICSAEENDFFMGIMNNTITMIGLYLPTAAAKPSRIYEWADGSDCQYRNWLSAEPDSFYNDTESVAQMVVYGRWRDVNLTGVSNILYCKQNALSLQEYADTCASIDNCAQIK